jgi:hypothetical protein
LKVQYQSAWLSPSTKPFQQPLRELRGFVVENNALPPALAGPYAFPTSNQPSPIGARILSHEAMKDTKGGINAGQWTRQRINLNPRRNLVVAIRLRRESVNNVRGWVNLKRSRQK